MASANRHWPSLFKSKPCHAHRQGNYEYTSSSTSLLSDACQKTPYASGVPGGDDRSPETKPRWNPKPEQIRILEAVFNSGMVNPPRDEIRRIRALLQEYGQVGDANVFYWFQNRKSRSKQKYRHLQGPASRAGGGTTPLPKAPSAATSSSSSSSDPSTASDKLILQRPRMGTTVSGGTIDVSNSSRASVNQTLLHQAALGEFPAEDFCFQTPQHGYCFPALDFVGVAGLPEQGQGLCTVFFTELLDQQVCKAGNDGRQAKAQHGDEAVPVATIASAAVPTAATVTAVSTVNSCSTVAGHISDIIQGMGTAGGVGGTRSTVFINEVEFEVGEGSINVREAFGEEAILLHPSGHPVLLDEQGVTIHPLQHGAAYYLV